MRGERILTFVWCFLAIAASSFGQAQLGGITGRAQDSSGALIPGVEVTITSPSMIGGARTATTDETGLYRFTLLNTGTYRVSFALPGFKTINIDGVTVNNGATTTINGVMQVASVAEEVTVTSNAPTIDLQAATVAVNWSAQKMDSLPFGRDLRSLAQMVPGLAVTTPDIGGTTLGGATGTSANTYGRSGGEIVSLDGNQWGTIFGDYQTVEEIRISTAAKGAEAQNPGANINMVIKSGSNSFHGSAMASWQDGKWQSDNVTDKLLKQGFVPGNSKFSHYDDYNFELGGKLIQDKLWFYGAFSHQFAGQYISGFISEKTGQQVVYYTQLDNPTLKISYQLNPKMKLEAFAQGNRKWQPYRDASAFVPLEATQDQNAWTMNGPQLKWTYILSPKMTLDAAFSRGGFWWPMLPHSTDVRKTDLLTTQTRGAYIKNYQRPIVWQYNSTWAWFTPVGSTNHEIKSGYLGTWRKDFTENFGYPYQQLYRYRSVAGDGTNYFSRPNSVLLYDYPNFNASVLYYNSWFLNDKITVNRKVTLNAGIRYERYSSELPEQGNTGVGPWSTKNLYPENRTYPVYNNVVPRVSVVYDVHGDGKFALKSSYGRYFTGGPAASTVNPSSTTTYTFNNWDGTIPYTPVYPAGCQALTCATNFSSVTGGAGDRTLDPGLKGSWMDEYTAGAELGFRRDYVFRFNAVRKYDSGGSKVLDVALPYGAYNDVVCATDPGRDNAVGTADDGRICAWSVPRTNPNFSKIISRTVQVGDKEARNLYMAYEATFNKQYANGWSFLGAYTASFTKRRNADPQNPNTLTYNWQLPEWNYGVKFSGQKNLPYGFMYSSAYSAIAGQWYGRSAQMSNALGSTVTILVEGHVDRYPWIKLWDNRFSKTVKIGERQSVEGMIDIFNTLNSSAIRSLVTVNGPNYMKPISPGGIDASAASAILTARTIRIGGRWRF